MAPKNKKQGLPPAGRPEGRQGRKAAGASGTGIAAGEGQEAAERTEETKALAARLYPLRALRTSVD